MLLIFAVTAAICVNHVYACHAHYLLLKLSLLAIMFVQLSSIHRHLDEMDRKLNVMQLEMEDAIVMSEYDLVMGHLDDQTGNLAANYVS